MSPVLSLRNVTYRYPGAPAPALVSVTIDFFPGEVTVLTGANGSGKTTLLQHCNALLIPDEGAVSLGGDCLSGKSVAETARLAGLLCQHADYQIFESTIVDELAFGPRNLKRTEEEICDVVERMRSRCSLGHIDPTAPPLGLSGGEKQRVSLAAILAMETPVILLDEPTFGLDPGLKASLAGLLRNMSFVGKTVIVATHDEEFARACGDRFVHLGAGSIESDERVRVPADASQETTSVRYPGGLHGDH